MVKRQTALKVVNPILLLLALYQGITGFFRVEMYTHFKAAHPIAGGLLLLFIAIHLALNWPWVRSQFFKSRRVD